MLGVGLWSTEKDVQCFGVECRLEVSFDRHPIRDSCAGFHFNFWPWTQRQITPGRSLHLGTLGILLVLECYTFCTHSLSALTQSSEEWGSECFPAYSLWIMGLDVSGQGWVRSTILKSTLIRWAMCPLLPMSVSTNCGEVPPTQHWKSVWRS